MLNFFKNLLYPILLFSFLCSCNATKRDLLTKFLDKLNSKSEWTEDKQPKNKLKRSKSIKKIFNNTIDFLKKDKIYPTENYEYNKRFFFQDTEILLKENKDILIIPFGDASLFVKMGKKKIFINPCISLPTPVDLSLKFLNELDFVLITDNHYLDPKTFQMIARLPKQPTIITHQTFKEWLIKQGIDPKKIIGLYWWTEHAEQQITRLTKKQKRLKRTYTFTLLPSHHCFQPLFYGVSSECKWGSFLITYEKQIINPKKKIFKKKKKRFVKKKNRFIKKKKIFKNKKKFVKKKKKVFKKKKNPKPTRISIYFAGQTGPSEHFKTIGKKYPIDVAIFPIASQIDLRESTKYYMYYGTALQASKQLGARAFVPLFSLFDEDYENNIYCDYDSVTIPLVGEAL
jgi:L-ascorbate metabolism protein UlaG (beta-lactamase superfamily)